MLKNSIKITLIFIAISIFNNALSQNRDLEQGFSFTRNFNHHEYKAHTQNFCITQDQRGIMYIGNFIEILEYDGSKWRKINSPKITKINTLATDAYGRVYVGANGDFGYLAPLKNGSLKFISLNDVLSKNQNRISSINYIFPTKDGVFFVAEKAIFYWENDKFSVYWKTKETDDILSAFRVNGQIYLMLKENGFVRLLNGLTQPVKLKPDMTPLLEITVMLPLSTDTILIGASNQGLYKLVNNCIESFHTENDLFLQNNNLTCGALLYNGTLAIGTDRSGIIIISRNGAILNEINKASGLQNENINYLFEDSNQSLWAALNSGIAQIDLASPLSFFNEKNGLGDEITGMIRHKGALYMYGHSGVNCLKNGKVFSINGITSVCWQLIACGNHLLAATSDGVFSINELSASQITNDFTLSIFQSKITPSLVYLGKLDELAALQITDKDIINQGKIISVPKEIQKMSEDENGNLWLEIIGEEIVRYNIKKNQLERFGKSNDVPPIFVYHINRVGQTTLFTTIAGIYKYNTSKNKFEKETFNDAYFNETVPYKIIEDGEKNLWTTAWDETNVKQLTKENNGTYSLFDKPFLPVSDFVARTIYPEKNKITWLAGPDGVIRYNPAGTKKPATFFTLIRQVTIGKDSVLFNGAFYNDSLISIPFQPTSFKVELDYAYNSIAFDFSSTFTSVKGSNQYRYMLEGYDKIWSMWNNDTRKEFTNLPDGKYVFMVMSKNIFNEMSEITRFSFNILTPLYNRWYAWLIYILAGVTLVLLFIRYKLKSLQHEKEILENIIKDRTKEIVFQKEEIEIKSLELTQKNDELEKINIIVQSINSEIHFNNLLLLILEKLHVIKGMETASVLLYDKPTNSYKFKASYGFKLSEIETIQLSSDDIKRIYMTDAVEIFDDIFVNNNLNIEKRNDDLDHLKSPRSLLIIVINIGGFTEGFILVANKLYPNAFEEKGLSLTKNLKEHLVSAFIKTKILQDLQGSYDIIMKQKEDITSSIFYAGRIQNAVLPSIQALTGSIEGLFVFFRPRDIVSGDFYWFRQMDGCIIVAAADCTGHGVPGAFMSMLGIAFLNEIIVRMHIIQPNLILNELRHQIKTSLHQTETDTHIETKDGMDISLCTINPEKKRLQYAGAYNPLLLYRTNKENNKSELIELKADKMPIGIFLKEKESFTNHEIHIEKDDLIYLFSDGYIDQFGGPKNDKFKTKRFKAFLETIHTKSLEEQKLILQQNFESWKGSREQLDDVMVLGIKI